MNIKKIIVFIMACLCVMLILAVSNNNYGDSRFSKEELMYSYNESVDWLFVDKEKILNTHNPMLWWMLIQSAELTGDERLIGLVREYKMKNIRQYYNSVWSYLFYGHTISNYIDADLTNFPDYNIHFLYGFSCDNKLAEMDIIKRQNNINFCWKEHPVSPACLTHQLMSFRFMQRTNCNSADFVNTSIDEISKDIKLFSTLDFRVVDVYLQRVVMQFDSGYMERVNPRWIRRILDHQQANGSWSDFYPIISLWNSRQLGFNGHRLSVQQPKGSFHMTAQGIWLMAIMLDSDKFSTH